MTVTVRKIVTRLFAGAGACIVLLALPHGVRAADDKPAIMKISVATVDDALHQYAKNYAAAVEAESGGRIKAEVYPASQLGSIQRQAEGVQFGAIQCQIVAPEFLFGIDERFEVLAAPGLINSVADGQRVADRPGGAEADARARRREGAAWRRFVHGEPVIDHRKIADPPPRRLQGQEDPDLRLAVPKRGNEAGLARRQSR